MLDEATKDDIPVQRDDSAVMLPQHPPLGAEYSGENSLTVNIDAYGDRTTLPTVVGGDNVHVSTSSYSYVPWPDGFLNRCGPRRGPCQLLAFHGHAREARQRGAQSTVVLSGSIARPAAKVRRRVKHLARKSIAGYGEYWSDFLAFEPSLPARLGIRC